VFKQGHIDTLSSQSATAPRRRVRPRARAPRFALERRPPRCPCPHTARAMRLPHMPAPRGSLKSPRATRRRRPRRTRSGARHGPPVRPAPHYTRAGRGRQYHGRIFTVTLSSSLAEPPLFKAAPPSRKPPLPESPPWPLLERASFFPRFSSPADTPNASPSSQVRHSLRLLASREPSLPATPPVAAAAAGPRRAPTLAISPPQLRPPLCPR
jgi:hypothetical protein